MMWFLRLLAFASCLFLGFAVTSCGGDEDDDTEDSAGPMATGSDCNCGLCQCAGLNCPPAPACCANECAPPPTGGMPAGGGDTETSPIRPNRGGDGDGAAPVTLTCESGRASENDAQCRSRCDTYCEEGDARDACRNTCCTRHSDYLECTGCCVDARGTRVRQRECEGLCQRVMR